MALMNYISNRFVARCSRWTWKKIEMIRDRSWATKKPGNNPGFFHTRINKNVVKIARRGFPDSHQNWGQVVTRLEKAGIALKILEIRPKITY